MELKNTAACPQWAEQIASLADGTLEGKEAARATAHVQACPACAQTVKETAALRQALRALPPRQTSARFEANLAARLAETDAQRKHASWQTRWGIAWQAKPRFARPALALAAMTALAGAAFFGHVTPQTLSTLPPVAAPDAGLVSHCVEQHRTEAAAQPLSDLSAQNLAAQVDGSASADATMGGAEADGANEDGL